MFRVEAVKVGIKTNHQTDALNFAHSPLDGKMKRSYHDNGTAIPTPQLTGSIYLWLMRSSVQQEATEMGANEPVVSECWQKRSEEAVLFLKQEPKRR